MKRSLFCALSFATALAFSPMAAKAAITIGTTDTSDGAFAPASNVVIDLSQATVGAWDASNAATPGKGRYDASKWAVVFKYSSVTVPAGVTVTFKNNASHAPVVWLVNGNVSIAGTINLNGADGGTSGSNAEPGPGGFRGGTGGSAATPWSGGFGYGGGIYRSSSPGAAGSYATVGAYNSSWQYGNPAIIPLIGGSGGGGDTGLKDGGAGGGAILIAAKNTLTLSGTIVAKGGLSPVAGGSGGGVRLVADLLTGGGSVDATGAFNASYAAGTGRVRLEANSSTMTGATTPVASQGIPIGPAAQIWPAATAPSVVISQVAGVAAPTDPHASFALPSQDVTIAATGTVAVRVQATNVPLNWSIIVRGIPKSGTDSYTYLTRSSGDATSSTWDGTISMPNGLISLVARAYAP